MKVRNLYIGSVLMINEKEDNYNYIYDTETDYKCKLQRVSIFCKTIISKNKVKDILEGGTYNIGFPEYNPKIGDEFIDSLDAKPIIKILHRNNYFKNSISKRKLLRIMANDRMNQEKIDKEEK